MALFSALSVAGRTPLIAQAPASTNPPAAVPEDQDAVSAPAMFPHTQQRPWYIAGQANSIFQAHPAFSSPYEGPNSFVGRSEYKVSLVGTLYLGLQPWQALAHGGSTQLSRYNTDLILNVESAGGRGLSQALGLAGFTNLDVVRNPTLVRSRTSHASWCTRPLA